MTLFAPGDPRPIHFMGIGGAGMSALALLAKQKGVAITGCDTDPSGAADLAALGVRIWRGHDPGHLDGARAVVVTAAVAREQPELARARALGIPVVRRAPAPRPGGSRGGPGGGGRGPRPDPPPGHGSGVIAGAGDPGGGGRGGAAARPVPVGGGGTARGAAGGMDEPRFEPGGSEARVELPGGRRVTLRLRVPGMHNVRNAAAALAATLA